MQKNSNFVKINKTFAVICSAIVLMTSILTADLLVSPHKGQKNEPSYSADSIYRQLEYYNPQENTISENIVKMNNSGKENANAELLGVSEHGMSRSFNGYISLLDKNGGITAMPLEDYVVCVLAAEMPLSFDLQALMAQAVAVRSYTVRCALYGSKHENADVCSDYRCCQACIMPKDISFDISKAYEAVKATKGIVAVYDGMPILAAYHASSCGMTKSSEEVWGGKVDYLVPVFAPEDKSVSSKTAVYDKKKIKSVLEANGLYGNTEFISDDDGLCVCVKSESKSLDAKTIQRLFGLRSDTFSVTEDSDSCTFTTYGFGHGVGMSQYGADALAKDGYSFYEILKHYYTGISFAFSE